MRKPATYSRCRRTRLLKSSRKVEPRLRACSASIGNIAPPGNPNCADGLSLARSGWVERCGESAMRLRGHHGIKQKAGTFGVKVPAFVVPDVVFFAAVCATDSGSQDAARAAHPGSERNIVIHLIEAAAGRRARPARSTTATT